MTLFTILVIGIVSAIANINNVQILISSLSTNVQSKDIYNYAVLYFVFNSFSRIISGLIIDSLIQKRKIYHFVIFVTLTSPISQLIGISMDKDQLLISFGLAGACHGGLMTFTPIYSKQFGIENMGKVLGFLTTGCTIGSLIFSDFIFTTFYEKYQIAGLPWLSLLQKCIYHNILFYDSSSWPELLFNENK